MRVVSSRPTPQAVANINTSLLTGSFLPSAEALEQMAAAGNTLPIYLAYFKVSEEVGRAIMEELELDDDDHYSVAAGLTEEEVDELIKNNTINGKPMGLGDEEPSEDDMEGSSHPHECAGWAGAASTE